MMEGKLFAAVGALIFAGVAVHGIKTGRFKIKEFTRAPYLRRTESAVEFWTYAILLSVAALILVYITVFIA